MVCVHWQIGRVDVDWRDYWFVIRRRAAAPFGAASRCRNIVESLELVFELALPIAGESHRASPSPHSA